MAAFTRFRYFSGLMVLALGGPIVRSEAETLFSQSHKINGYREITPDQGLNYDTWVSRGKPGLHATPIRIPKGVVLRNVSLEMAASPHPTGGFSLSFHAYIKTRTGSYLKTVAELSGTDNPAAAGSHLYHFPEGFSSEPGVYFLVARVAPGGGTYRWTTTANRNPQIGSGGQVYAVTSVTPSSYSSGSSWTSSGSSFQLGGLLTISNPSLSSGALTNGAGLSVGSPLISNIYTSGSLIFASNLTNPNPTLSSQGTNTDPNPLIFSNITASNLDPPNHILLKNALNKSTKDLSDVFLVGEGESGPNFRFTLTGEPAAFARLSINRPVPFKPVPVGRKGNSQRILIRNTGTAPLTRLSIEADSETRKHFKISLLFVRSLEPNATAQFVITAKPGKSGMIRGRIAVKSAETSKTIPLIGRGTRSATPRQLRD